MKEINCLIRIENLVKEFGQIPNERPLRVLDGASLTVSAGDAVALMGPNGSGKTTLLRIIAGELAPTAGEVYLVGRNMINMPAYTCARFIGRVHQESYKSIASDLTVEETLALASCRNRSLLLRFPKYDQVLEMVRKLSETAVAFIEPRKNLATRVLSGGQRQLLAIIAAILGKPQVLLLDEHLAALDNEFKTVANDLIHEFMVGSGGAFVAVTHDLLWAKMHTNRVAQFLHGTLTF